MKRTTIALEDDLHRKLKDKAARDGRTFQEVANELLEQGLAGEEPRRGYRLRLEGWQAEERPGVNILDRDRLFYLTADGR